MKKEIKKIIETEQIVNIYECDICREEIEQLAINMRPDKLHSEHINIRDVDAHEDCVRDLILGRTTVKNN